MNKENKTEYIYHARRYWVQTPARNQHIGWNTDFEPCVVFKKTAKRIGILSPTLGVLYLNRTIFDRDGKVYHSKPCEYFYRTKPTTDPEKPRKTAAPGKLQTACEVLGLSFPVSATDAKRAYKRLARKTHPDNGGLHEDFVYLNRAYQCVMASIGARFRSNKSN